MMRPVAYADRGIEGKHKASAVVDCHLYTAFASGGLRR
jgi:hypothetical protein